MSHVVDMTKFQTVMMGSDQITVFWIDSVLTYQRNVLPQSVVTKLHSGRHC